MGADLGGYGAWPLWSGAQGRTKNVGRDEVVAPGQNRTLVEILGDDSCALLLTGTLDGPRPDGPAFGALQVPRATAIIEWGNGGLQSQAEIDFIRGCTFSVGCSFLRIIGHNGEDAADADSGDERLGAFVSYLPRVGTPAFSPQLTIRTGPLVALASTTIAVPSFATDLWVYAVPVSVSLLIEFLDAVGTVLAATSTLFPVVPHVNTPLPNGARSVRFTATGGLAAADIQAIFRISM